MQKTALLSEPQYFGLKINLVERSVSLPQNFIINPFFYFFISLLPSPLMCSLSLPLSATHTTTILTRSHARMHACAQTVRMKVFSAFVPIISIMAAAPLSCSLPAAALTHTTLCACHLLPSPRLLNHRHNSCSGLTVSYFSH